MKKVIDKCTVDYSSWQMQCCGDPISVGKVADILCVKGERYKNYVGIEIDYDEDHHQLDGPNCWVRGLVTRIQAVFVDKYARIEDETRYVDDPNNEFFITDANYIDGYEDCANYGHRKAADICSYIITLENAVEREYSTYSGSSSHGKYIKIEPGDEGKELFWDENDNLVGDTYSLSFYEGDKRQVIDFTQMPWHAELKRWRDEYLGHIESGYDVWSNQEWLDWWCTGYLLAKEIRQLLPPDVELNYGMRSQSHVALNLRGNEWELNYNSYWIYLCPDMNQKAEAGLFIPRTNLDLSYEQDKYRNYKFIVSRSEHHLFPEDRVMLCVYGRPIYQLGIVVQVNEEDIIIHTDKWLDISEEYSIELIV